MPVRLNVKIFVVGKDTNVYVQVFADTLLQALRDIEEYKKQFAKVYDVTSENVGHYVFGDSDSKKLQIQINELRDQVGVLFDTFKVLRENGRI